MGILTEDVKRLVLEQRLAYIDTVCPEGLVNSPLVDCSLEALEFHISDLLKAPAGTGGVTSHLHIAAAADGLPVGCPAQPHRSLPVTHR